MDKRDRRMNLAREVDEGSRSIHRDVLWKYLDNKHAIEISKSEPWTPYLGFSSKICCRTWIPFLKLSHSVGIINSKLLRSCIATHCNSCMSIRLGFTLYFSPLPHRSKMKDILRFFVFTLCIFITYFINVATYINCIRQMKLHLNWKIIFKTPSFLDICIF